MAFTSQISGAIAALLVLSGVVVATKPDLIEVDDFAINGRTVTATRTIHGKNVVADWRVIIVPDGKQAPICQTVAGPELHQGWSVYSETDTQTQAFDLDFWAGDPGCYDRMPVGEYTQYVTWTPRNGGEPVSITYNFKKEAP